MDEKRRTEIPVKMMCYIWMEVWYKVLKTRHILLLYKFMVQAQSTTLAKNPQTVERIRVKSRNFTVLL